MYACGEGEEKRKAGGTWVVGKKKKEIKKKKIGEWGIHVWWEKRERGKRKKKKKIERKKIKLFLFEVKCRIVKIYLDDVYNIYLS